jgi:FtsH-binding integral membrane protein
MKVINDLKSFWRDNKYSYLWSCLALFLVGSFIGLTKKLDMTATSLFILAGFPVILVMAFGIYKFTGGNHE